MDAEEHIGPRDMQQANGRPLPDYPTHKVDAMAVQNATGSLEIMGQLVLNEWELLRRRIRELGVKIRQMSTKVATISVKRLWVQLLSLLRKHGDSIPKQYELDAALILNDMEIVENEKPPPRDTLADIRRVLLEDTDEEGVIMRKLAPAWRAMPPPRRGGGVESPMKEGDTSAYQLFNRPMTINDDDFDRLSLPSGTFAQSESEKIMSLEAQLALLSRQLNSLMMGGLPQQQQQPMGAASGQRVSRPVSRTHSRASLYSGNHQLSANHSHHHNPNLHHHPHQHGHVHRPPPPPLSPSSPSPSPSDDDGVYMQDANSASSYASPSHTTMIPLAPQLQPAGGRLLHKGMAMTGDATSAIPPAPPLPPLGLHLSGGEAAMTMSASSPPLLTSSTSTLVPCSSLDGDVKTGKEMGDRISSSSSSSSSSSLSSMSPPGSPLPPPPPGLVQQQMMQTQEPSLSSASSRSFLDDINSKNFSLRKTSSEKPPPDSIRSSASGEDAEHDENAVGPLVKPTTKQLLSRKVSLKRISADRSPGGTPQTRNRRRAPSLGQDNGRTLHTGEYLAAALANQFKTIRVNEEDDDQSVTAGDQSWLDD